MYKDNLRTELGILQVEASDEGIQRIEFVEEPAIANPSADTNQALDQLRKYFAGELKEFDLRLDLKGSDFQISVWNALLHLPYGATTNYGTLASQLGDKNLSRAVGLANGKNPIAIVVPCHRVIGADGSLTGYAGGLDRKSGLLSLEGAISQMDLFSELDN